MVAWLPGMLQGAKVAWQYPLPNQGIGGVAATDEFVIVTSRDRNDALDVITCLDAMSGVVFWQHTYQATGDLDYGNSIRATPLIADPYVVTLGAFGDLHCLDLGNGKVEWSKHLVRDLHGVKPQWGYAASPIVVEGRLIVQPGGDSNSIAALELETGGVVWQVPGRQAAYASLVEWVHGPQRQVIGFDYRTLGGWDIADGKRIWEVKPKVGNDFNVPTPIVSPQGIFLTSENNGTRLHRWTREGVAEATPAAEFLDLAGDSHTPILIGDYLVGVDRGLRVLDTRRELAQVGELSDPCFDGYCSLIGSRDRVLVQCEKGELLLLQIGQQTGSGQNVVRELDRMRVGDDSAQILAHGAIAGSMYFVRLPDRLQAWQLPESVD
jgi:outer membrane protein assembly factor BamB